MFRSIYPTLHDVLPFVKYNAPCMMLLFDPSRDLVNYKITMVT
jgi:hypothetical protein